jgi:large subunit ribosomal protein L20
MARVKRGVIHSKTRRNLLKKAKGFKWGRKKSIKLASTAVTRAGVNAYRSRRLMKRNYRQLWTVRLNAALRPLGMSYSRFIDALKKKNITLDRKVLAQLAAEHPAIFAKIVEAVK